VRLPADALAVMAGVVKAVVAGLQGGPACESLACMLSDMAVFMRSAAHKAQQQSSKRG